MKSLDEPALQSSQSRFGAFSLQRSWMAGSAAVVASGVSVDAGTVQITLTGEQVTTGNGTFTGDLTGDTTDDVPNWVTNSGTFSTGPGSFIVKNYSPAVLSISGSRFAYAAYQTVAGNFTGKYSYARAGSSIQYSSVGYPASARTLVAFTFSDSRINGDNVTNALADIHAFNNSITSHTVEIVRTVFDDASTDEPVGVTAGGSNTEWAPPAPEIDIEGNGNSIADGDTTPSTMDGTDFGSTTVGAPVLHNFLIRNTGTADLSVTMVAPVTGDFGISGGTGVITPGNSLTLEVSFTPASLGVKTATVTVTSDDADESTYTFDVTGTAVSSATPSAAAVASTVDLQKVKKLKKQLKKAKKSGKKAKAKKIKKQIKKLLAG